MGVGPGGRYDDGVRRYFTPRCIGMHVTLVIVLPLFAWLTWWQWNRAQNGNVLSWAYVILWPAFAAYAIYTWWQLIHDQVARLPGRSGQAAAANQSTRDANLSGDDASARPPGWALTGGRAKSVAIASEAPIDPKLGGRGERFTAQTPEEAARMEEYNRYLEALSADDQAAAASESDGVAQP